MNTLKINKGNTLMVAHRGVSGLEQENTSLAFVAAGNRSYFGIETDIHVTSDGVYVAIHDGNTGRVAKEDYVVAETDFATLRALPLCDLDGEVLIEAAEILIIIPSDAIKIMSSSSSITLIAATSPYFAIR